MLSAIAFIAGSLLLLAMLVIFLVSLRRDRRHNLIVAEADSCLMQARSMVCSTNLPTRRRAGANVSRIQYLLQRRGLKLDEIKTTENELLDIMMRACARSSGETQLPIVPIDSGLPKHEIGGYSGRLDVEIIPVYEGTFSPRDDGSKMAASKLPEWGDDENRRTAPQIHQSKPKNLGGSVSKDRARAAKVRNEIANELTCRGVTEGEIETSMDKAFSGLK